MLQRSVSGRTQRQLRLILNIEDAKRFYPRSHTKRHEQVRTACGSGRVLVSRATTHPLPRAVLTCTSPLSFGKKEVPPLSHSQILAATLEGAWRAAVPPARVSAGEVAAVAPL